MVGLSPLDFRSRGLSFFLGINRQGFTFTDLKIDPSAPLFAPLFNQNYAQLP
jgi:hypothetical protein